MKSSASRWGWLALTSALSLFGSACGKSPDPDDTGLDGGGTGGTSEEGTGGKTSTGGTAATGGGGATAGSGGEAAGGEGGEGDGGPPDPGLHVSVLRSQPATKLDLLFMIDNSISMADKQSVLKTAIPDLVRRLVAPNCVNSAGAVGVTPASPDAPCPTGYAREFTPARDMHIGVITSSLGGHGAPNCDGTSPGIRGEQENDHGHLIATRPRFATAFGSLPEGSAQPPQPEGFLDWEPGAGAGNAGQLTTTFQAMVTSAGEFGCGYESQLESVYRFLADPAPHARIDVRSCSSTNANLCAFPEGVDAELLAQRRAFLRPDSAVGVVLITDENDCSIIQRDQGFYAARADDIDLPRSTAVCATNPNDRCCVSCISPLPQGCEPDPACSTSRTMPDELDPPNLRCFKQKQRFGIDFLYPTERYVNALKNARLCTSRDDLASTSEAACPDKNGDGEPDMIDNPLFTAQGEVAREASHVFLAGIVGVPWQDLQAIDDDSGRRYRASELHYKSASRLAADDVWAKILGNPMPGGDAAPVPPTNALMIESLDPRSGTDGQGNPLAPPSSPSLANPVNSHEWGNTRRDDLQYACVFRLPEPRDCARIGQQPDPRPGCDCEENRAGDSNPLCQSSTSNEYETNQHFAKAYPGLRELQVLKDFGENSVVASICARNLADDGTQDYGYRPAMDAIVDRVSEALDVGCLARALPVNTDTGSVACQVVEVRAPGNTCDAARNRRAVDPGTAAALHGTLEQRGACGGPDRPECGDLTLCAIAEAGSECHGTGEQPQAGWCYIDPARNQDDDPSLVEQCSASKKRTIRFVDPEGTTPEADATTFIVCENR